MTPRYHRDLIQGTDEWLAARCGLITASEVKLLITGGFKRADNATSRGHMMELVAQRITQFVEPRFISDDMLRGMSDEADARALYAKHHAPVDECGFVTQDFSHRGVMFTLGCSPDGLVGDEGLIEIKSRRAKFQVQTILDYEMPAEFAAQVHAAMLITDRAWCDFVSYSGGLPLFVKRVHRDPLLDAALLDALAEAEEALIEMRRDFDLAARPLIPTERKIEQEMMV